MTTFPTLPPEWQDWLDSNIKRQVPLATLATTLSEHGFGEFARTLVAKPSVALPFIDTTHNSIHLDGRTCQITMVCDKPYLVVLDNFLSMDECEQLITLSDNKFLDAMVVDDATGDFVKNPHRTSMNTAFNRGENELISTIEERIAKLIHWDADRGEGVQVLRYGNGGEYKAHFDFFDPNTTGGQRNMVVGGQRVGTFLMYLSDVDAGGATRFPSVNLEVRPKAGMAIYFADLLSTGEPDRLSLHASTPVVTETKYLATKWLREKPYS